MELFRRSGADRRSGEDRRNIYDINYFLNGGVERRHIIKERRLNHERREGWVRITEWGSMFVGA